MTDNTPAPEGNVESTRPSEQPERIWMSPPPKTGVRLTVEECARQFELYAKSHPSPDSAHSLRFCADFLREFAVSPGAADLKCVKCGHHRWLSHDDGSGICKHIVDDPTICGCKCEFTPANSGAPDLARKVAEEIYQNFVSVTPNAGWTGTAVRESIAAIISRHFPTDAVQARRQVWEDAIAAVPEVGVTYPDGVEEFISAPSFREDVIAALEAAALRADGKEKDD